VGIVTIIIRIITIELTNPTLLPPPPTLTTKQSLRHNN